MAVVRTYLHRSAPATPSGRGLWGLVLARPLTSLTVWFTLVGQPIAFAPVISREVYGVDLDTDRVIVVATLLGLLLPALVITRVAHGRRGLRALLRAAVRFDVPLRWYLLPLVVVPATVLLLTWLVPGGPPVAPDASTVGPAYVETYLPALLLQFGSTNWWEEVVWTGVVQAPLQERHGAFRAALVTTPLFAFQHVSLMVEGSLVEGVVQFIALTVVIVFARAGFGWIHNRTGSLALVGLTHAASNAVAFAFMPRLSGETGQGALALVVLGLVAIVATRGRLGLPDVDRAAGRGRPGGRPDPPAASARRGGSPDAAGNRSGGQ